MNDQNWCYDSLDMEEEKSQEANTNHLQRNKLLVHWYMSFISFNSFFCRIILSVHPLIRYIYWQLSTPKKADVQN